MDGVSGIVSQRFHACRFPFCRRGILHQLAPEPADSEPVLASVYAGYELALLSVLAGSDLAAASVLAVASELAAASVLSAASVLVGSELGATCVPAESEQVLVSGVGEMTEPAGLRRAVAAEPSGL